MRNVETKFDPPEHHTYKFSKVTRIDENRYIEWHVFKHTYSLWGSGPLRNENGVRGILLGLGKYSLAVWSIDESKW